MADKIDCAQMPQVVVRLLAQTCVAAAKSAYKDDKKLRKFEEWQHSRKEEQKCIKR